MLAVLAVTALGINCTELIRPRDPSPIRSPQNIHSWLSERFAGLEIVEIGTRNGDGMACFAQTARAAIAVEIDRHYCEILRKRAARLEFARRLAEVKEAVGWDKRHYHNGARGPYGPAHGNFFGRVLVEEILAACNSK